MSFRVVVAAICLMLLGNADAVSDTITLTGGKAMECKIVQDTPQRVLIILDDGLVAFGRGMVENVERAKPNDKPTTKLAGAAQRIPDWETVVTAVAAQPWCGDILPIPATVIGAGVLKNVPYKSQRCVAKSCEFNVYGDPDAPAGFELGVYGPLLKDDAAKKRCIELVAGLLLQPTDQALIRALQLAEDKVLRNDWTFEVTPPTAEDAYGGWWISVYNEKLLDGVRASPKELAEITADKSEAAKPTKGASGESDLERLTNWSKDELGQARASASKSSTSGGGGRVYVRGYTRKDGTYVRPHSRRR